MIRTSFCNEIGQKRTRSLYKRARGKILYQRVKRLFCILIALLPKCRDAIGKERSIRSFYGRLVPRAIIGKNKTMQLIGVRRLRDKYGKNNNEEGYN